MKNISLALNAILVVAVAILFYLHFSNLPKVQEEIVVANIENEKIDEPVKEEKISSNIAYLNVDSLQSNYKLYSVLINKLKRRQAKYEKELQSKSAVFEKKVMVFQKKAPTMTQFEGQMRQKELAEEEQVLYKLRDDFAIKFQNEEGKLNEEFQNNVKGFIQEFNDKSQYNLIIGASQVGNVVLDYNEGINITNQIVEGLNKQYDLDNAPKEEK
ncbi:MAG: OmpH family outer membrane protein [Vicingaceae bacterium]|jgi:outer membrane protein|tara:strand:- start:73 stop:714 length:642 start_codon:yes stop_codon:yes gene_type:complete